MGLVQAFCLSHTEEKINLGYIIRKMHQNMEDATLYHVLPNERGYVIKYLLLANVCLLSFLHVKLVKM